MHSFRRWVGLWYVLVMLASIASAQENPHTWEVYVTRGVRPNVDRLTFQDVYDGTLITTEVTGERYTPLLESVLYFDYLSGRVMVVGLDGLPRPHPFIQMPADARRVDWVVSYDKRMIAWTITTGTPNALTTLTRVADVNGVNIREVLRDGVRDGVRVLPIAFNVDQTALFMDAQPDGIAQFAAYPQYAGLFRLDLEDGSLSALPNEPTCFCGAGFRAGLFLRLVLSSERQGYDVRIYELENGNRERVIPALARPDLTQAGGVVVSADGTRAIYALARVERFGTPQQRLSTVFVEVDLLAMTQTPLIDPTDIYLQPVLWTDDNSAVLLTSSQQNGTWKLYLIDRTLRQVATATFLGKLTAEN